MILHSTLPPGTAKAGGQTRAQDGLQHTANHKNCPACIEADMQLVALDSDFSRFTFNRASELWMELRGRGHLKARTHESNRGYLDALARFFGEIRLCDITAGHLRAYQIARTDNSLDVSGARTTPWKRGAGHSIINHELSCLARILKHARLWVKLQPYYFPLAIPKWSPRDVLSEEDEETLFSVAASHPEAALAYWIACITNNTTAAGCELRGLRIKNLFLRPAGEISEIYIPEDAVKNSSRPRKIALNRTARWAVEQCYKRALRLGACEPEHYLFPLRLNREKTAPGVKHRDKYDATRPASRWFVRKSWDKLRAATGLKNLNPHDLRHQCITRLLENGVMPETVRAIAGHVTAQMMEYYSHIRREAKYDAVMAIELDEIKRAKKGPRVLRKTA
jgi:integrase